MLNKTESKVFSAIYYKCRGGDRCIIGVNEISSAISVRLTEEKVESVMKALETEDYLDSVCVCKNDTRYYSVRLHSKGLRYTREKLDNRRNIVIKIVFAVISAVITFAFGRLLLWLFS